MVVDSSFEIYDIIAVFLPVPGKNKMDRHNVVAGAIYVVIVVLAFLIIIIAIAISIRLYECYCLGAKEETEMVNVDARPT